jgi:hypothetical protein
LHLPSKQSWNKTLTQRLTCCGSSLKGISQPWKTFPRGVRTSQVCQAQLIMFCITAYHTLCNNKPQQFACYEHSPGFRTIRVKVLKLDTTAGCVDAACPLDNTRSLFSPPSDIEASRTLEAALKHWLVQLRAAFSDDDSAPGLTDEVTILFYASAEPEALLPFETFRETLNHIMSSADFTLGPPHVHDRRRDWEKYRHTLTILSSQSGRYLFKTTSGGIGFGTRKQTPGNHVVLSLGLNACECSQEIALNTLAASAYLV